jgi:hypothetical protein
MTASSDPRNYGEMTAFEMPQGESVLGPVQIDNRIKSTTDITRELSLLNQQGSTVIQGSLQLIPVGNSILYIRPFYVQGAGTSSFPQFRFVVVAYGDQNPVRASTVEEGLAILFGQAPPQAPTGEPGAPTPSTPPTGGSVQELLDQAADTYRRAQEALRNGNLGTYQELINQVGDLINQAQQGGGGGGAPTTTTTTPARQTSADP